MANTTNYNWETPDDTDLVKDGAAAIRTLGSSIDTTTKNLNPQTTTGALAYRSATANVNTALPIGTAGQILAVSGGVPAWINNDQGDITEVQAGVGISVASGTGPIPVITNSSTDLITTAGDLLYGTAADTVARLGIGTAGQVLKVNSGATAPEWGAAASASGLTLVSATTFSSVNAHSVNSCFTSTYRYYRILCDFTEAVSTNRTLNFRLRASGSDTTTNYTDILGIMYNTNFDVATGGAGEVFLGDVGAGTVLGHLEMTLFNPNGAAPTGYSHNLNGIKNTSLEGQIGSGVQTASTAFDGFTIYLSSENMSGTIKVYGYAN